MERTEGAKEMKANPAYEIYLEGLQTLEEIGEDDYDEEVFVEEEVEQ